MKKLSKEQHFLIYRHSPYKEYNSKKQHISSEWFDGSYWLYNYSKEGWRVFMYLNNRYDVKFMNIICK